MGAASAALIFCALVRSACGGANYIETVWGRGYVLREPDSSDFAESA